MMDAGNISGLESFEFPYGKAAKKEQENKVDDANIESDNLRAEQNSSSPVVKEDKPVENVANSDVSANDNAESSKQDKPTVEDRTEKSRGETIDEFIARTNREKEANQPSPPSMDEQEREAAREERRKAIEQRKLENAKKRAERAKEYERQLKLREEQNQKSLMNTLKP